MDKIRVEQHGGAGLFWIAGWLYTIGFLHLSFGRSLLAILVWPYYVGDALRSLLPA